jgi:Cys-tRNA synthase (O-phospho-L-seryl-tRNA:Cys-tRNA synthase)
VPSKFPTVVLRIDRWAEMLLKSVRTVEALRKAKGLAEAPTERRRARSCLAIMVVN